MNAHIINAISIAIYFAVIISVGVYYARRASQSSEQYFLGGRSLGPLVTAMSAEASDMSGWLLMGLPGLAYFTGLADAFWTALGLGIGTYVNWLVTARRLRVYSIVAGDSITVPDFFSQRFRERKPILMTVTALIIIVFFSVYAASCFVTVGKLFHTIFDLPYIPMMIMGACFVVFYTVLGGFLAESTADTIQAFIMIAALISVLGVGLYHIGGLGQAIENARRIPGFMEFFGLAQPTLDATGTQIVENGQPVFEATAAPYSKLQALSMLSWGLGYFGVPQVLLRFMAIRSGEEIKMSRRIATIWVFISLFSAIAIGIIGRDLFPTALLTSSTAENVFIISSQSMIPTFLAGFIMAGILAATVSSSDSYLLISSSAVAKNIYKGIINKDASDKQVLLVSRIVLISVAIFAMILASNQNSVIFNIVSFAWAGFGACFAPVMITSLFWRRTTRNGALAGMIVGAITVFVWNVLEKQFGGIFTLYELLPAFILALITIIIVSLAGEVDPGVEHDFELYERELKAKV
jgi:sodium/proline symporter